MASGVNSIPARFIHQGVTGAVGKCDVANDGVERLIAEKSRSALQIARRGNDVTAPVKITLKDIPGVGMIFDK